ncbi:MAG: type I-U CRISPR-associated helicase/endonuclease Cas3 [Spirochaetaceae bacterium]|nr:type I-U CRISPR-associated helicase/endonuclease Cas3 [Spirochaetaceae bacterium]
MSSTDFAMFFQAIHGHTPFPWQQSLVERLDREDCWPDVLDLPTGAGKTAALDAAVFHLAMRADTPSAAALRIVLVVDRRLVVDDAYERAHKIERALTDPSHTRASGRNVVEEVARRLQQLSGSDSPPLVAARLRGGAPLEHDWARTPTQPTLLCSTVDQVGSRLLFRGYGVSDRMKPVHAGLLGEDSLILLDEAHLSEPFRKTLGDVHKVGRAGIKTVVLTATPGAPGKRPFALGPRDRADPVLKARLHATKRARLMKPIRNDAAEAFARAACEMAEGLRRAGVSSPAVGVVVNRVALAREVFQKLSESKDHGSECLLMIGRSRDVTRDQIVEKLAPFRTGAVDRADAEPMMLVATQCLEVGVDLDLDGLVTQAASFDALRQRFGRLNRAGRPITAEGAILVTSESLAQKTDDPVYGDRIRKTWEALNAMATAVVVDFGVEALDRQLKVSDVELAELAAPRAQPPTLMPAYLDLWSQTSPPPVSDPEVGLFLHGTERSPAEVSLVWRSDITDADMGDRSDVLKAILELVPPRAAEMIDVPIWAAAAWLRGERDVRLANVADVPERPEPLEVERSHPERKAFRWAGSQDPRTGLVSHAELRPGDVLVVPAHYGGCDRFGWAPESRDHVADVGDEAAWAHRGRRYAVRVARDMVPPDADASWKRITAVLAASDGAMLLEELLDVLPKEPTEYPEDQPSANSNGTVRDVRRELERLRIAELNQRVKGSRIESHFPYAQHDAGVILVAPHGLRDDAGGDQRAATEDDTLSHTSSRPVALQCHTNSVVAYAESFARTLGLSSKIAADVSLAAFLHDAGKSDARFQTMLAGGDRWNRPDGPPLAKSGRTSPPGAWVRSGLPSGWRHEALSVRMALVHARFAQARDPELVLWLIGTHHGLGRPFFDFADPQEDEAGNELRGCLGVDAWHLGSGPGPQSLGFAHNGLDWTAMFQALKQRYGIWGLVRLETILRLADHRASEAERG